MAIKMTIRMTIIHTKGSAENTKSLVFSMKKNRTIRHAIIDRNPVIFPKPGMALKGTFLLISIKVIIILTIGRISVTILV